MYFLNQHDRFTFCLSSVEKKVLGQWKNHGEKLIVPMEKYKYKKLNIISLLCVILSLAQYSMHVI
jgi:hypothetical protein